MQGLGWKILLKRSTRPHLRAQHSQRRDVHVCRPARHCVSQSHRPQSLLVLPGLVLLRYIHCVLIKRIPNIFSCNSRFVSLNCGIRQGGVLPLYLFAVYIDSIFDKVKHNGLGCNIKWFCLSVFLYADDILLLATTVVTYLRNRASVD